MSSNDGGVKSPILLCFSDWPDLEKQPHKAIVSLDIPLIIQEFSCLIINMRLSYRPRPGSPVVWKNRWEHNYFWQVGCLFYLTDPLMNQRLRYQVFAFRY